MICFWHEVCCTLHGLNGLLFYIGNLSLQFWATSNRTLERWRSNLNKYIIDLHLLLDSLLWIFFKSWVCFGFLFHCAWNFLNPLCAPDRKILRWHTESHTIVSSSPVLFMLAGKGSPRILAKIFPSPVPWDFFNWRCQTLELLILCMRHVL